RAIREVGILGERVMLPAPRIRDCLPTPYARRAIEIEEHTAARASGMLQHKMAIQQDGFHFCEEGIIPVDMGPSRLDHANPGIAKVVNRTPQEIFGWNKVSVKDRDELAFGALQSLFQRSCLVAVAIRTMMIGNWMAQRCKALYQAAHHLYSLIRRVIQYLDIQFFPRIVEPADALDQPLSHIPLVEHGQLHGDSRQFCKERGGFHGAILLVLVIEVHQEIAVNAVGGEESENYKVGDEQGHIERVCVIEPLKSAIKEMLSDELPHSAGGRQSHGWRRELRGGDEHGGEYGYKPLFYPKWAGRLILAGITRINKHRADDKKR